MFRIGKGRRHVYRDRGSKEQFQSELAEMVNPDFIADQRKRRMVHVAQERPPTINELLDEVKHQVFTIGPNNQLTCLCGAASFQALKHIHSGPDWVLQVKFKLSKFIPPCDVLVIRTAHLANSGDLY